jgi:Cdc6-like AAA superfamily ATPase
MRLSFNLPKVADFFEGRNEDVKNVLFLLKKYRLVTITGEPGIGKTYIAKKVADYVAKRNGDFLKNGVMFMNVINCSSKLMLF